ncbi:uncharacterized protein BO66DRAFT_476326 [Aspergillus aculeatinus CBS 121060]|uniref:Uncharacterized protein n=1 Tax=Aspergillus aculeatinus CBS 121060 TaxID=1448322 RepID=A0ACD1GQX8_9EURO|nr:hypothetical protein BO66DRAFT_476326 [Aspergillus aculeatinus CBS 121060]RAH63774.1 hypothetical protein BO66DRAFT_476326 [Aspergillus aculeatinus CBS 121060]
MQPGLREPCLSPSVQNSVPGSGNPTSPVKLNLSGLKLLLVADPAADRVHTLADWWVSEITLIRYTCHDWEQSSMRQIESSQVAAGATVSDSWYFAPGEDLPGAVQQCWVKLGDIGYCPCGTTKHFLSRSRIIVRIATPESLICNSHLHTTQLTMCASWYGMLASTAATSVLGWHKAIETSHRITTQVS